MTHLTEFPDFPAADMPQMPEGFVDQSWHNETCPGFDNEALGLKIWVDYLDPEMRELQGFHRFTLVAIDAEFQTIEGHAHNMTSDNWDEILKAVADVAAAGGAKPTEPCDNFQSDGRGCCRHCGHFHGKMEG